MLLQSRGENPKIRRNYGTKEKKTTKMLRKLNQLRHHKDERFIWLISIQLVLEMCLSLEVCVCLGWVKPFSWKNLGIFFLLKRQVTFLWVRAICLAVTCCGDIKGRGGVSHFEELVAIQFKEIAWNGKWF